MSAALTRAVDRVTEAGLAALALATAAVGCVLALVVAARRMDDVREFASAHTAAVGVGLLLAGSAAVLLAGVTAALRRRE